MRMYWSIPLRHRQGENADRADMDIEKEDRQRLPRVLKLAKEKGLKTVVLLNVAGPVDMRTWEKYADSILCIFIPGCMGGVAAADMLFGEAYPAGKLPVTFPKRLEDTPCYPNFPGGRKPCVLWGKGIFVGIPAVMKNRKGGGTVSFLVTVYPTQNLK